MSIILIAVRLSNDIFKHDIIKCDSGINGLVNIVNDKQVPFVTLEFYDTEARQRAIRRYFMKKNTLTGNYDQWSGKSPSELQTYVGKKLDGKFVTRNGVSVCIFKHEYLNEQQIENLIEKETDLGFDLTEKRTNGIADFYNSPVEEQAPNNTQVEKPILQQSKKVNLNNIEQQSNRNIDSTGSILNSKNKNLFKGFAAVSIMLAIILFIFYLVGGALNGIAGALASIPKWLRITLFVGAILIFKGAFDKSENK